MISVKLHSSSAVTTYVNYHVFAVNCYHMYQSLKTVWCGEKCHEFCLYGLFISFCSVLNVSNFCASHWKF